MKIVDLFEAKKPAGYTDNADPNTGFFGAWGAGCIVMARSTGRFLIGHRSNNPPPFHVEQPGQWGTFGGKADYDDLNPTSVAVRELDEETQYRAPLDQLLPLFVFRSGSFRFYNFLAIVPKEFQPRLNWENQGARWVNFGDWPEPIHFGLSAILNDSASVHTMQQAVAAAARSKQSD